MSTPNWEMLAEEYLSQRRALGYQLHWSGRELLRFAQFLCTQADDGVLTVELALVWANLAPSGSPIAKTRRLAVARGFARFVAVTHPKTEIPPPRLLGQTHRRLPPTIFSDLEIDALLQACSDLIPRNGLRPWTMRTLIGLLAATGLRPGEAVRLRQADVDTAQGLIYVAAGKLGRSRWVPLHPTACKALDGYNEWRNQLLPITTSGAFFARGNGEPFTVRDAGYAFRVLCRQLSRGERINGRRPRLYDLRHTFVCRRLLAWYQSGIAIEPKIPYLASYLGHRKISSTYWYLTGIPELMEVTVQRFEHFAQTPGGAS